MIYGMTASRPDPLARFEGTVVLLRALEEKDLPALFTAIGRPEIFAGGWGGGMGAYHDDFEQWSEFLRQWLPWQQCNVYAVVPSLRGRPGYWHHHPGGLRPGK